MTPSPWNPIAFGRSVGSSLIGRRNASGVVAAEQGKAFSSQADVYRLRRAYYDAKPYDLLRRQGTAPYSVDALPRTVRGILQLVKPACDWYRDNLYRGAWTSDGRPSSTGKPNMVPWEADSPDELVAAAQQFLTWGNWAERVRAYCFYGPVMGDVFLEAEVDPLRQKVYPVVYDPSFVTHLVLDGAGNVIAYKLVVPRWDVGQGRSFLWGKLVTKETVTTYYNDREQGFSTVTDRDGSTGVVADDAVPAEVDNAFGFCPAAWVNHRHNGSYWGECVADGMFQTIDELNGMQAAVDDFIRRFTDQKIIVGSDDPKGLAAMLAAANAAVPMATAEMANPNALRDAIPVIPGPPGIAVIRLLENLGLGEAVPHFDRLMGNLTDSLPEIFVEEKLGQAGDVTGPGARAIVAPVQRRLDATVPGYDRGLLAVTLMGISMMGELLRTGVFTDRTEATAKFAPYDLGSWDRGDLAGLGIQDRDLVPPTTQERAADAKAIEGLTTELGLRMAGVPTGDIFGKLSDGTPVEAPAYAGLLAEKANAFARQQQAAADAANRVFGPQGGA